MKFNKHDADEAFDNFLVDMDDQLEWLVDEGGKHNFVLDYTPAVLDRLEKLFDLMTSNQEKEYISKIVVVFGRYLGEYFRKNHGGKWELHQSDEKNVNFNSPIIMGFPEIDGLEFAPLAVMRAYSMRGKPGTLHRAVDANVNLAPLDLSSFIERE